MQVSGKNSVKAFTCTLLAANADRNCLCQRRCTPRELKVGRLSTLGRWRLSNPAACLSGTCYAMRWWHGSPRASPSGRPSTRRSAARAGSWSRCCACRRWCPGTCSTTRFLSLVQPPCIPYPVTSHALWCAREMILVEADHSAGPVAAAAMRRAQQCALYNALSPVLCGVVVWGNASAGCWLYSHNLTAITKSNNRAGTWHAPTPCYLTSKSTVYVRAARPDGAYSPMAVSACSQVH